MLEDHIMRQLTILEGAGSKCERSHELIVLCCIMLYFACLLFFISFRSVCVVKVFWICGS